MLGRDEAFDVSRLVFAEDKMLNWTRKPAGMSMRDFSCVWLTTVSGEWFARALFLSLLPRRRWPKPKLAGPQLT